MIADTIHEHTVMGHEDQRALEVEQEVFQPFNSFHIQMIGRFVKQQNIRAGSQHAGQFGPFPPAPGKLPKRHLPFDFRKSEPGKRLLCALFGIIAVLRFKPALFFHKAAQFGFIPFSVCGLFPAMPKVVPVMHNVQDIVHERHFKRVLRKFLFHITQAAIFGQNYPARIRLFNAGKQAQKC